tara:strand:- start:10 stop:147 length:138 start_codon:yes stop_codon:yes gene_type:complete
LKLTLGDTLGDKNTVYLLMWLWRKYGGEYFLETLIHPAFEHRPQI